MQKKLIALAIAAAFSAPAFADSANVSFYGKVNLDIESVHNDKNAAPASSSATRINSNASRFGLKGSEDVAEGLKAIFQYEVQVDANGNSGNGFGNGTRNSGVGLAGDFGQAIVGVWDTPFKTAHNKVELFDNTTVFSAINLIGRANGNTVNYNTRQKNMVQYWSPNMGGVQVAVSYSPDPAPTSTTNKNNLSMAATYDVDALYLSAAYERRADETTAGTTNSATRLVARYAFGDAWLGATLESIKVNPSATASYSQKNAELVGQYKIGTSTIALSYAKAGKTDVDATGAKQVTLRYGYNFSKRTEAYVAYTSLKNDTSGTYNFNGGTTFGTSAAGASLTAFGAGMIHSF